MNRFEPRIEVAVARVRAEVARLHKLLVRGGLATWTSGVVSGRVPDSELFVIKPGGLDHSELAPDNMVLVDLDGNVVDGTPGAEHPPTRGVTVHAALYRHSDAIGGIVHTHSPYVTSFAIANKPIEPTYEAMVRFDINEAVPVAAYGARGSERSVSNIIDVVNDTNKAVLLANHGLLAFDDTLEKATHLVFVLEEAAQFSLMANVIGGAQALPPEAIRQTQERRVEFERAGVVSADDE